jgi:hypothetical protein
LVAQGFACQTGNPSGLLCLEFVPKLICFLNKQDKSFFLKKCAIAKDGVSPLAQSEN